MSRTARTYLLLAVASLVFAFFASALSPTPAQAEFGFLAEWGSRCSTNSEGEDGCDGRFSGPSGIAVDPFDNVFVVDSGNDRVQKLNSDGGFLTRWGSYCDMRGQEPDACDGQFNDPSGIAVSQSGDVYVTEYIGGRVQKFNSTGDFIAKWGEWGETEGQFLLPVDVAVDPSGNVYVVEHANSRIQVFDSTGAFQAMWGWGVDDGSEVFQVCTSASTPCQEGIRGSGDGEFRFPDGVTVGPNDSVYVADTHNHRIQAFGLDGSFQMMWGRGVRDGSPEFQVCTESCQAGTWGTDDGEFWYPEGVGTDSQGNVYVADKYNNRFQKFSPDGSFLDKWGIEGSSDGQFQRPYDIDVDSSGNVYVADGGNHRIQKFGELPPPPDNIELPTVSGTARFSQDLACSEGTWNNNPTSFGYVWQRNNVDILLANDSTYTIVGNDIGAELTCRVIASNPGGSSSATSDPVGPVPMPPLPANIVPPTISGTARVGERLTCFEGAWDNDPTSFGYVWQRNGADIVFANSHIYITVVDDIGADLTCRVTASNVAGSSSATSDPVRPVSSSPLPGPPSQDPSKPLSGDTYKSACNLKITSPKLKIDKSKLVTKVAAKRSKRNSSYVTISAKTAGRLFRRSVKGYVAWGKADGRRVSCEKIKIGILQKRGKRYYIPGTKIEASGLSAWDFQDEGRKFLVRKKVGKLKQKRVSKRNRTNFSYRNFSRKTRLGRRALRNLKKHHYRGTYVLIYVTQVEGNFVKKTLTLKVRRNRK